MSDSTDSPDCLIIIIIYDNNMVAMSGDLSLFMFFVFYRLFDMFLT